MKIKLPNITGKTEQEQLRQIGSYLRQLAQELNWALQNRNPVTKEEMESVSNQLAALTRNVEQLGKRLQEHIKGG